MPLATDIMPITGFTRGYQRIYRDLKKHGRPKVLTIDGRPAIVVQDAAAYERMVDLLDAMYVDREAAKGLADKRRPLTVKQVRRRLARSDPVVPKRRRAA